MKKVIFILTVIAFVSVGIYVNFINETTQQHKILSIDKIEATEGNSEGFKTRVYYQVSTDKGAYHIRTDGINAAPQCVSIKKDSVYILTTRGVNIPIIGVYSCIIDVKENAK